MDKALQKGNFASAVMIRLVAAGLVRYGLDPLFPVPTGAHVPAPTKRTLLQSLLERYGPLAVVRLVDAAGDLRPEPVVQALTKARGADDLIDRWKRLEKFSHGKHEVLVEKTGACTYRFQHVSRVDGEPPHVCETLLVIALLTVLMEMASDGWVQLAPQARAPWRRDGVWLAAELVPPGTTFQLTIGSPATRHRPSPELRHGDLVEGVHELVLSDLVRKWSVADLATMSGNSTRTLQRRLRERGTSMSLIVNQARLQRAATLLNEMPEMELAEVGFVCGYSDQAHFTRSFSGSVGTTPKAYRSDFAAFR